MSHNKRLLSVEEARVAKSLSDKLHRHLPGGLPKYDCDDAIAGSVELHGAFGLDELRGIVRALKELYRERYEELRKQGDEDEAKDWIP